MAAQENHMDVVQFLLDNGSSQSIATEVSKQAQTDHSYALNACLDTHTPPWAHNGFIPALALQHRWTCEILKKVTEVES